jgi:hypothetical protein
MFISFALTITTLLYRTDTARTLRTPRAAEVPYFASYRQHSNMTFATKRKDNRINIVECIETIWGNKLYCDGLRVGVVSMHLRLAFLALSLLTRRFS